MSVKFSRIDIGSMKLKNRLGKIRRSELRFLTMPKKPKTKAAALALAGLALITALQAIPYLSSAQNAKGEILGQATSAYSELNDASQNLALSNFTSAQELFISAQANLKTAQGKLDNFKIFQWFVPSAATADHLLTGASGLAEAGEKLSQALALFDELKVSSKGVETSGINQKISENRRLLAESLFLLEQASEEFDRVKSIPADYSETLDEAKTQVRRLRLILHKMIDLESLYLNFFGGNKTYLLAFQNYDEVRATGGFIGTYGVLKITDGSINKLKIESIYNLDGQINQQVAAPGPFQPDIKKWGLRDANWFADFPTSAEKLLYFFELGSQTADGVVAATPQIFEQLLNLVGPIEMPEYDVVLTSENFQEVVQFKTSVDYDRVLNQPKKFLDDFAPLLLDRLNALSKDQWLEFLQILENNLKQRHILLYSKDQATQKQIDELGASGKILAADSDYLAIINSNLGGTKTDLEITQKVRLKSKILSDGSIINTLTISRKNTAPVYNKSFVRILVPLGSQLVSAEGFDEYPQYSSTAEGMRTDPQLAEWDRGIETGKTRFSGWVMTHPDREREVTVTYMLPFKFSSEGSHSLLVQKQSGSQPYEFSGSLNSGGMKSEWLGSGVEVDRGNLNFKSNSNTDDFWGMVLSK